jgi:hypothetical protein
MVEKKTEGIGIKEFIDSWAFDPNGAKRAFLCLREALASLDSTELQFHKRPGVSYSLRAALGPEEGRSGALFALVDVVDDPSERWLSVCFYERMITDPDELGETVPKGLLGEDGYCFHVTEYDDQLLTYLKDRISEAYGFARQRRGD